MKKFLIAILAMLYLCTSAGATVHLHFCMGKLVETNLWHSKAGKCGKCGGMEKPAEKGCTKNCCEDKHKLVKGEKDQLKAIEPAFQAMQSVAIAHPLSFIELPPVFIAGSAAANPVGHAPPRSGKVQLHILHSTFLI